MQSSSPQHQNKLCGANDGYDPNQNKYHDGGQILINTTNNINTALSSSVTNVNHGTQSPQSSPYHHHQQQQLLQHHHLQMHGNDRFSTGSASLNGMMINSNKSNGISVNSNGLSSGVLHPALLNIINEAQGMKFRGTFHYTKHLILLNSPIDFPIFNLIFTSMFLTHFRPVFSLSFRFHVQIDHFRIFNKRFDHFINHQTIHRAHGDDKF